MGSQLVQRIMPIHHAFLEGASLCSNNLLNVGVFLATCCQVYCAVFRYLSPKTMDIEIKLDKVLFTV
jgi:hypothetical protein